MKRLTERELSPSHGERSLQSIRAVVARATDVLWQADAQGNVTAITTCRPSAMSGDALFDEAEIGMLEQLWRKSARVVERFGAVYHVRSPGSPPRSFLIRAVPVLDERDAVLYWSGITAETDGFAEADTRFISEVATVLSSSLNRSTIVNRLLQASIERFCDLCAAHTFDDQGAMRVEGVAARRADADAAIAALDPATEEAVRTRRPLLVPALHGSDKALQDVAQAANIRSLIVVPLLVGNSCVGALSFAESDRTTSFAARDLDVAVIVSRQFTMALENIKTFEREQRITQRFRFLARVTDALFGTLDPAKMLQMLLEELLDGFADYGVAVAMADGRLDMLACAGTKARFRESAEHEIAAALLERRSLLGGAVADVSRAGRFKGGPLTEPDAPRSWMMVPLFVGDTIYGGLLCCSNSHEYDAGELELLEEIGRRASLALEHAESFARERRLIQTLQQATLPTRLATIQGASLSAIYLPAASEVQVGGDWYDAFDLDGHRVLLTVGDVTGHGLEASIVMGKLRHAVNVVAMYEPDPARILDAAERILLRRYPGSIATAFAAIFDARRRTITYANAGHPYPVVRRGDGSLQLLEADGLPIGLRYSAESFRSATAALDDASLLAFYTDGLTEATRDIAEGERVLNEALSTEAIFYAASPAEFVEKYCLRVQPRDDVAILLVNFVQSQRWKFDSSDWRAARRARQEFVASLRAVAEPESDFKAAELIFGELAANVARHAGGHIEAALEWHSDRAALHMMDRGEGYSSTERAESEPLTEHGRGLWLIQRLGAQLAVETLPGFGAHVKATLPTRRAIISSA